LRITENVPGKYYVDTKCIGCDICPEISPGNFCSNLEEGYEYVCRQPINETEEKLCAEAMEICPVNAIRDDGIQYPCEIIQLPYRRKQ
jgi:ferredoxin